MPALVQIAAYAGSPLRVIAGPGTGKTCALMRRITRFLDSGLPRDQILAVTFTRTAASDLVANLAMLGALGGWNVRSISFHRFSPNGVSGVVVVSESHLSVHTWPEYGYVALDIFTCGSTAKPEAAVQYALKEFGASAIHTHRDHSRP